MRCDLPFRIGSLKIGEHLVIGGRWPAARLPPEILSLRPEERRTLSPSHCPSHSPNIDTAAVCIHALANERLGSPSTSLSCKHPAANPVAVSTRHVKCALHARHGRGNAIKHFPNAPHAPSKPISRTIDLNFPLPLGLIRVETGGT